MLFIPQFYTFELSSIFFFLSLIFTTVLCLGLFELITTDRLFFHSPIFSLFSVPDVFDSWGFGFWTGVDSLG